MALVRKPPNASRNIDAIALVFAALLIICSLVLAEGLRPVRPTDPLKTEPKVYSFVGSFQTSLQPESVSVKTSFL